MTPDTVAVHKYIMRRGKRVGYYSGYTLANRMGLSTQIPFTQEINSNFAPALVRKTTIKTGSILSEGQWWKSLKKMRRFSSFLIV